MFFVIRKHLIISFRHRVAGKTGPGAKTMKSDGSDYQIISAGMITRGQLTHEDDAMMDPQYSGIVYSLA